VAGDTVGCGSEILSTFRISSSPGGTVRYQEQGDDCGKNVCNKNNPL
jgi:hypothetical protein